jgi:hypothetical protein
MRESAVDLSSRVVAAQLVGERRGLLGEYNRAAADL